MTQFDQVYVGVFIVFIIFAVKLTREGREEIARIKSQLAAQLETHASFLRKLPEQEKLLQALLVQQEGLENDLKTARAAEEELRAQISKIEAETSGKSKAKTRAALKRLEGH